MILFTLCVSSMRCTVWVKNSPSPCGFLTFSQTVGIFNKFLHCYYMILYTLDYKFLFNYFPLWQSCISWARAQLAEDKNPSFGQQGTVLGQEVAMVEEFVYLGSLVHSSTQSSPDISRRNAITRAAMQNLDKQIWRSRITNQAKVV